MPIDERLVEELTRLDDADFVTVIERARRRRTAQRPATPEPPGAFDRDALARWYALRHLNIDPTIREVIYLPAKAPANEIRLIEVNTLSTIPDESSVEALDFGADVGLPGEHRLLVADVTPGQWNRIAAGTLALPHGWELAGNQVFGRR
jgi:hypothetical protein